MTSNNTSEAGVRNVQEQTEEQRLLRTDLDLCNTLVGQAESELATSHKHAVQTFNQAVRGYNAMVRVFKQRRRWSETATKEIGAKLARLRQELERLQHLAHAPSST